MEDQHVYEIYKNVIIMLKKYRKLEIINGSTSLSGPALGSTQALPEQAFWQQIEAKQYIIIECWPSGTTEPKKSSATLIVIFLAPTSNIFKETMAYRKFRKSFEPGTSPLLFISQTPPSTGITKLIVLDPLVEVRLYNIFCMEIPTHVLVPQQTIADPEEVRKFCAEYHTDMTAFPKILTSDPMAAWLGLTPGMCVKVIQPSETVGETTMYRYCSR
jgi:DNA-directed RNA polymerase subunit H (RpoH/RPB5)